MTALPNLKLLNCDLHENTREMEKFPCLTVNSLSVNSLLATICGKSIGDLYPENRREQVVEKTDVTFCSLAER